MMEPISTNDVFVLIKKSELDQLIAERNLLRTMLAEKDAQIVELNARIAALEAEDKKRDDKIGNLQDEIKHLKVENNELRSEIKYLRTDNDELKAKIAKRESLLQLKNCNDLASKAFQTAYRKCFNKSKYDRSIPFLGDFMNDEPTDENSLEYAFWQDFIKSYPGTNNENIKEMFRQINWDRNEGEHPSVTHMSPAEFDKCMRDAFASKYSTEQNIQYREWSFLFPS